MLISIVSLSNFICWTQGVGSFDVDATCPPVLAPEVEQCIAFEQIDIISGISAMNREMERISEFYQFVFPTPFQIHENMLWMSLNLARLNTRHVHQGGPGGSHGLVLARDKSLPRDLGLAFGKSLAKAKTAREAKDLGFYLLA